MSVSPWLRLPEDVKESLPVHGSFLFQNYFIDKHLVCLIDSMMIKSTGAQLAKTLKELEQATYLDYHLAHAKMMDKLSKAKLGQPEFFGAAAADDTGAAAGAIAAGGGAAAAAAAAAAAGGGGGVGAGAGAGAAAAAPPLPTFNATVPQPLSDIIGREDYNIISISSDTVLDIYKMSAASRADVQQKMEFSTGGEILYMDATFPEAKHIRVDRRASHRCLSIIPFHRSLSIVPVPIFLSIVPFPSFLSHRNSSTFEG